MPDSRSSVSSPSAAKPLTLQQIIILSSYGAILWYLAALLVSAMTTAGLFVGIWKFVIFAAIVPGTIPSIWIARKLARLEYGQTANGFMVGTAAALLLDGAAHAWFPSLYGLNAEIRPGASALIFWGAGVGLILALMMRI